MECWILYDRMDLDKNLFFAGRLRDRGLELGMDTRIVTTDSMPDRTPDAVVSRMRDWRVTSSLESDGATVFNSSAVSRICNDKEETYVFAESLGIPVLPRSVLAEQLPDGPPWVVKSRFGHGGTEVHMAESRDDVRMLWSSVHSPLIQTMAPVRGRDLRVYVLNGRPIASVMRSNDTDFRANHGLGGKAEVVEPPDKVLEIVNKIVPELRPDFAGIDFVFGDGCVYLNEIEDVVGTRMLYELTDLDPARDLMDLVQSKISL